MITHTHSRGTETEILVWNAETLWQAAADLPVQTIGLSEAVKQLDYVNWDASPPLPGVWNDVHHAE